MGCSIREASVCVGFFETENLRVDGNWRSNASASCN